MLALLGGTSWPSTVAYYEGLNRKAEQAWGPGHSAELLLKSVDYFAVRASYATDWPFVRKFLREQLQHLDTYRADGILICNNTLHKAYDELCSGEFGKFALTTPVVHIVEAVAAQARQQNVTSILLLAVKFTMEDGFYQRKLESLGLNVVVPSQAEREEIQAIQTRVSRGEPIQPEYYEYFHRLVISSLDQVDGVALACTELPLVVQPERLPIPVISSIDAHINHAWEQMVTGVELVEETHEQGPPSRV